MKRLAGSEVQRRHGHRDVTAICQRGDLVMFATDEGADGPDELNLLTAGADYGPQGTAPVAEILAEEGGLGGCAAAPDVAFVGALDGERVHVIPLGDPASGTDPQAPEELLGGQYGRLRTVVLDAEGALWVTTSNRDGVGTPRDGDDKVLRILPPDSGAESPL